MPAHSDSNSKSIVAFKWHSPILGMRFLQADTVSASLLSGRLKVCLCPHLARASRLARDLGKHNQSIGFSASSIAGDGKVFLASEDGDVYVIRAGPLYELMAVNPMGEAMIATPAISGGIFIVRGEHHVFGIAGQ